MGENLIKPYEISVWEDKLTQDGFIENKLAVIGSDTMTGPNKVYSPVFNKKSNGEKTLSFNLKYKYFDPYTGNSEVVNPFAALLQNERKVKLKYGDEWYEFIVKDHTESSDELTWTYTCVDAFVLELSKTGYNLTFDSELNNNQGTAAELAGKVLEDTDWQLGDSDNLRQLIAEPVYEATLLTNQGISIINTDTNEEVTFENGTDIYLFYSYVKNQSSKYVQFIIRDDNREYTIDDQNVITDTNYRIVTDLTYDETNNYFTTANGVVIITIGDIETKYQVNRLVYNQKTTYDPVMERTVSIYTAEDDREVYKYTDYVYSTSNVVTNFITNGDNFNALEDGTMQGWNPYVDQSEGTVNKLQLVTNPELSTSTSLADINTLSAIEGYLKVKFNAPKTIVDNKICNLVYNSGFKDNAAAIDSIAKGDKFVFRWRARSVSPTSDLTRNTTRKIRLLVAEYTQDTPNPNSYYYKHVNPEKVILDFDVEDATPICLDNTIKNGEFTENHASYVVDGVVQVPSTKYIYQDSSSSDSYIWNGTAGRFELLTDSNYLHSYYLTATAKKSITNQKLTSSNTNIGIFIYTINTNTPLSYCIQDIQLTRFVPDAADPTGETPVILGSAPIAEAVATDYYYLKPKEGQAADEIETFTSLEELATSVDIDVNTIKPSYNEDSEKYLTISASQTNCFDILQIIAETFECWVDLQVSHDSNGYIITTNGIPEKYVYLREYAGKDNWAGFKYKINLQSIERNVNSEEIVTKLIVDSSQSDYTDEGYVSIMDAPSNLSGESYILNFDYYYNQGLLDRETVEEDRLDFITQVAEINKNLRQKQAEKIDLEAALTEISSRRNVYAELVSAAQEMQTDALEDFETLTGKSYQDYVDEHTEIPETDRYTEEETIADVLGEIYTSSATINNYSGLLTNAEQEYKDKYTRLNGTESYTLKMWTEVRATINIVHAELSDYLPGVQLVLSELVTLTTNSTKKSYFFPYGASNTIALRAPSNYEIDGNSYIVDSSTPVIFNITPTAETTVIGINTEIKELQNQKDELVKNFTNKYRRYIQEGTWSSTDYIDSELYYLDAVRVSNTSAQPIVSYTINVVEISELEGFEWYKFDAGDKTYVEDTEFFGWALKNGVMTPAREEVIVSEVEWHLDEPEQNIITVQNYKSRFEDLFQRISATVQTVQYNEATYAKISTLLDANGTINQDVLQQSINNIAGKQIQLTSDGSIIIDKDNILIQNLTNTANRVIINSEGIRVSSDGGEHWQTAIDGQGINIGTVYTGQLNTNEVIIGSSENPSFRWDKSGISAYRSISDAQSGEESYDLQTYVRYDQYGLYGIKNDVFKAESLDDVIEKAHFAVTWDGFFIKNSYEGGGRVEITSDNDFRVLKTVDNEEKEVIKIGALEWGDGNGEVTIDPEEGVGAPTLYGIRITNDDGIETFKTGNDGNITITGEINATGGNFSDIVTVGKQNTIPQPPYIIIDGVQSLMQSSNYQDGAGYGWMINSEGDAVFNNITARGAIKTAVFEYAEIQAVGGIFIFRPSSTIRDARISGNDLILKVEKTPLFKAGQWCKISNYSSGNDTSEGEATNPDVTDILLTNGLTHVYQITSVVNGEITLQGAKALIDTLNKAPDTLIGGALIDMGNKANGSGQVGTSNYGIGINSSDNTVNLPARAITLFETIIDETRNPKVSYKYRGILGTLPVLQYTGQGAQVSQLYHDNLEGTQGIYTDNMYIGDNNQYVTFYTDKTTGEKKLRIKASQVVYEVIDTETGQPTGDWNDINDTAGQPGPAGQDAITVEIDSTAGILFVNDIITSTLICTVKKGGVDITNDSNYSIYYTWKKRLPDGSGYDPNWGRPLEHGNRINITSQDVDNKGIFECEVIIQEAQNVNTNN